MQMHAKKIEKGCIDQELNPGPSVYWTSTLSTTLPKPSCEKCLLHSCLMMKCWWLMLLSFLAVCNTTTQWLCSTNALYYYYYYNINCHAEGKCCRVAMFLCQVRQANHKSLKSGLNSWQPYFHFKDLTKSCTVPPMHLLYLIWYLSFLVSKSRDWGIETFETFEISKAANFH